jgi:hypothetical protein
MQRLDSRDGLLNGQSGRMMMMAMAEVTVAMRVEWPSVPYRMIGDDEYDSVVIRSVFLRDARNRTTNENVVVGGGDSHLYLY